MSITTLGFAATVAVGLGVGAVGFTLGSAVVAGIGAGYVIRLGVDAWKKKAFGH
mgnify:CR=1 FL=1